MEFKRVALYLAGTPQVPIVRALHCIHVHKSSVCRTIARYRDADSVARRHKSARKKQQHQQNGSRSDLLEIRVAVAETEHIAICHSANIEK